MQCPGQFIGFRAARCSTFAEGAQVDQPKQKGGIDAEARRGIQHERQHVRYMLKGIYWY